AAAPPPRAAAPAPAARPATPKPAAPVAVPVRASTAKPAPSAPRAAPVATPLPPAGTSDAIVSPARRTSRGPGTGRNLVRGRIVGAIVLGVVAPLAYVVVTHLPTPNRAEEDTGADSSGQVFHGAIPNLTRQEEKVFRLTLPKDVWKVEDTLKRNL